MGNHLTKQHVPELVAPAGDWASLRTAVENGADSVYFGIQGMNMRHQASNFDLFELNKVMTILHGNGKKGYLALNILVYDHELKKIERILKEAKKTRVDAVIAWDMAVMSLARTMGLRVHLSTQASVANAQALKFYADQGVQRVILARECTLKGIAQIIRNIRAQKVNCEIEAFVHGAMCVSISGRCFLSQFAYAQSANRGKCLQPCRREYLIKETDGDQEFILGQDYVLSPKDLCAIDFLDKLIASGVQAFKIEGRMRSADYVSVVTAVYRQAIDAYLKGKYTSSLKKELKTKAAVVYNRGFCDGFYFGVPGGDVSRRQEHLYEKVFIGAVKKFYKNLQVAEVQIQKGKLKKGDGLLFMGKSLPVRMAMAEEIQVNHQYIVEALKGQTVGVKVPFAVKPKDKVFLWQERK